MTKADALEEVMGIGYSYFYDELDFYSEEEILAMISDHYNKSGGADSEHWRKSKLATSIILEKCSSEELEQIANSTFGVDLDKYAGSRGFFEALYEAMSAE